MNKTKIYFTIILVIIATILTVGSLSKSVLGDANAFTIVATLVHGTVPEYTPEEAKIYACTVAAPTEPTVILRIDDIVPWNNQELTQRMTDDILSRGYGVTLGVIPYGLEKDRPLIRWVQEVNKNPKVELSLHGYRHDQEEFKHLNYAQANTKIQLGRDIMIKYFGEYPINFIPPYNVDSDETIQVLKDLQFKTLSGSINEYIVEDNFAMAGYTATTYKYSTDQFIMADQVLHDCQASLKANHVCVIMSHPQDFTTDGKIDEAKYAEYTKVLDGLAALDAQVVNFREAFCIEQQ